MKVLLILLSIIEVVKLVKTREYRSNNEFKLDSKKFSHGKNNYYDYSNTSDDDMIMNSDGSKIDKEFNNANKHKWTEIELVKNGNVLEIYKPSANNNSYQRQGVILGISDFNIKDIEKGSVIKVKYREDANQKSCNNERAEANQNHEPDLFLRQNDYGKINFV